jgi:hypothetical protein
MNVLKQQSSLSRSILLNKGEDPQKPKEGDDLKGAIPKGFEKFYKKKGED